MAVRDDWQGKGIGTALMKAVFDLADNCLNLTRIELQVYTDNAAGTSFQNSKTRGLNFRALPVDNGAERLELRMAQGAGVA